MNDETHRATTVIVRRATAADAAALAVANSWVQELHAAELSCRFKTADPSATQAWFRDLLERENVSIWLAEAAGKPVGYVLATLHERPENAFCYAQRFVEIDHVSVAPTLRRRGVARTMLECAVEGARAQGVSRVELSSWAFNEQAHAVFRALGFTAQSVRFELEIHPAPR